MTRKPPRSRGSIFSRMTKSLIIILTLTGVITMYFYAVPRYLQKRLTSNFQWAVQGSPDLEVTAYKVSVSAANVKYGWPLTVTIDAEVYNKGTTTLELLEVDSAVTDCGGNITATRVDDAKRTEGVDTTYYDKLPSELGVIIPPNQKRPLRIWGGLFIQDGTRASKPAFFWDAFGYSLFRWCKIQATVVVRPATPNVVEWYQFWNQLSYKEVEKPSGPGQACEFDLMAKFDPDPVFDQLMDRYGNKGTPNPNGPGRILSQPDGTQIQLHTFTPELRWVITFYDENGRFAGFEVTSPFEKNLYKTVDHDGYYILGSNLPCTTKIKDYKVYLELSPR